jgi:L-ribulose-5-phosphate 4-epimerase
MLLETLRREIINATRTLARYALPGAQVCISGIHRDSGFVAITPDITPGKELAPDQIALMDLHGQQIEGDLPPSPDTPTHLALYNVFNAIGGIAHAHTPYATMFAQAGRPIPSFGATHAECFFGEIPITRALRKPEIERGMEHSIGMVILERFARINTSTMPAVLVMNHGPFAWGPSVPAAAANGVTLENAAHLAFGSLQLNPALAPLPLPLQEKHHASTQGIA